MALYEKKYKSRDSKLITRQVKPIYRMERGLYSFDEVTALIDGEGYIPVATASELNGLRNAVSQTMGAGTAWEGTYTTGLDKKYIQVDDVVVGSYNRALLDFNGTYDGNNLSLLDMVINTALDNNGFIGAGLSFAYTARNIRIINATNTSNANQSAIFGRIANDGCVVDNVHLIGCSVTSTGPASALFAETLKGNISNIHISKSISNKSFVLFGSTGAGTVNLNNITFENCTIDSSYSTIGLMGGDFISGNAENISAINCNVKTTEANSINSSVLFGIIRGAAIVRKAKVIDSTFEGTSANLHFGGIVGLNDGTVINSHCNNVTVTATGGSGVGLISGLNRGGSGRIGKTENCYAYGDVFGSSNLGAICGGLSSGGSVVNSYYDLDVSNQSDTGKGLPRTTPQMQQGTADSFILPAGGVDGTSDPANAMYTAWDGTIWKFTPLNAYPTLR